MRTREELVQQVTAEQDVIDSFASPNTNKYTCLHSQSIAGAYIWNLCSKWNIINSYFSRKTFWAFSIKPLQSHRAYKFSTSGLTFSTSINLGSRFCIHVFSATWVSSPQKGLQRRVASRSRRRWQFFQGEALQKSRSVLLFIPSRVYICIFCMCASEKWRRSRNSFESSRRSFILLFDGTIKRRGGFFLLCLRAAFHDLHIKIEYTYVYVRRSDMQIKDVIVARTELRFVLRFDQPTLKREEK